MECELPFRDELNALFSESRMIDFLGKDKHVKEMLDRCDSSESSDSGLVPTPSSGNSDVLDSCSPYSSPRTLQSPEAESSSGYESSVPHESCSSNANIPENWPCGGTAGYLYHLQSVRENTLGDNDCDGFFPNLSFSSFNPTYKDDVTRFPLLKSQTTKRFAQCENACCVSSLPIFCVQPNRADDLRCNALAKECDFNFRCGTHYECSCRQPHVLRPLCCPSNQFKTDKNGVSRTVHRVQGKITEYFKRKTECTADSGNCEPLAGSERVVTLIQRKRRRSGIILDGKLSSTPAEPKSTDSILNSTADSADLPPHINLETKVTLKCQWDGCGVQIEDGAILEHLRSRHVETQMNRDSFRCLWQGCKVFGKTSCSLSWLSRHVVSHSGPKPFPCIVAGCNQKFPSHNALERHVNMHFVQPAVPNPKRSVDGNGMKLSKKNGKVKSRLRRSPWSARLWDFFDTSVMEKLRHQLLQSANCLTRLDLKPSNGTVTVGSSVVSRKTEPNGQTKLLVRWHPPNILPDEWVPECTDLPRERTVPFSSLAPILSDLNPWYKPTTSRRKRKPLLPTA